MTSAQVSGEATFQPILRIVDMNRCRSSPSKGLNTNFRSAIPQPASTFSHFESTERKPGPGHPGVPVWPRKRPAASMRRAPWSAPDCTPDRLRSLPIGLAVLVEFETIAHIILLRVLRRCLQSLLLELHRLVELSRRGVGGGKGVEAGSLFPLRQFAGPRSMLDRLLSIAKTIFATGRQNPRQPVARKNRFRVEPDGLRVVGNRLVVVTFILVRDTLVVAPIGLFWIEKDGRCVVGNRPVVVMLLLVGPAPLVICNGVFRVQPDGLAAVGDGLVVVALSKAIMCANLV